LIIDQSVNNFVQNYKHFQLNSSETDEKNLPARSHWDNQYNKKVNVQGKSKTSELLKLERGENGTNRPCCLQTV